MKTTNPTKNSLLSIGLAALCLLAECAQGQQAWSVSLYENGNGIAVSGGITNLLNGQLLPDPSGGLAGNVLVYTLPFSFPAGSVGDYLLLEPPNYGSVSDVIRFWGNNQVIFYSDRDNDPGDPNQLADTGLPGTYLSNNRPLNEGGIGGGNQGAIHSAVSGEPGYIGAGLGNYTFISDVTNVTTQCVETNGIKVLFPPNINGGMDVRDSRGNIVLADDFYCTTTGPITDIHLWGSWLSDNHGTITNFWLGIYNDLPAVTNASGQIITPSRPGANLLWQQSFGVGQYAESIYGTGSEQFYDPSPPSSSGLIGVDTTTYYYCFYPTNPFVQQGLPNQPTNYWLAAYVQIADQTNLYGWKTSLSNYNDAAVWGNVSPASGLPIGNWQSMTNFQTLQPINLSFKLTTPTNSTQTPVWSVTLDENGNGTAVSNGITYNLTGQLLPDPSGGIAGNVLIYILPFTFPAGSVGDYQLFEPPNYTEVSDVVRFWGSPVGGGGNQVIFYSDIDTGEEGPPVPLADTGLPGSYLPIVFPLIESGSEGGYQAAANSPISGQPGYIGAGLVNYTFISDVTNVTTQCIETNGVKYLQSPNLDYGSDVWNNPYVLADDFVCTNSGPISDIHIWGSWLNNQVGTNTLTFWLGIYDDVPFNPNGTTNTYSHPGNLLWQQWFAPGQYAEIPDGSGFEYFIDPGPPAMMGQDSQAWYYCFYPTNPLIQLGYPCAPKIYWLAAYAQQPGTSPFNYGWKSAYFVQNDISVHAPWPGAPPLNNPGWTQTFQSPTGPPLDLAFKITTDTNYNYNNNLKYIQWPNTTNGGYDVWNSNTKPPGVVDGPWVLADDFVCTNTGYISDIHLWGSWYYDSVATNQLTFWIGLFNDVPAVTNASGAVIPSHPGDNFWSQCFAPGCYTETYWSPADEGFLDPGTPIGPPTRIGSDFSAWYYSFYPTNPPIQWGSPYSPRTYWVGAFAQMPAAGAQGYYFGWKTTTNVQHDISVHSPWVFGQCPTNINISGSALAWTSTYNEQGQPLDLAFEISTITNCSASFLTIDKDYALNKVVVTWPSGILQWSTNVAGPYMDVPGAPTSPYMETYFPLPINPTNHFYRVRCN